MPRVDHFPSTHATWIDAQLTIIEECGEAPAAALARRAERAKASLRAHLWERYHAPLRAYVHGGSLRRAGDPDDLVAGYFADRVTTPEFLREWRRTDLPLRRWMMNGLGFYARGVVRDRMRDRLRTFTDAGAGAATGAGEPAGPGLGEALDAFAADDRTAEDAFDRAWAIAVLDAAHAHAHAELAEEGRLDAYEVFRRRVIEGEGYETIGPAVGMDAPQCAGATRLVSQRMARALREVLRAEGVRESEMDATMAEVRRAVGDAGAGENRRELPPPTRGRHGRLITITCMDWRERISVDPGIRFGKACVRGTRIAVEDILGWLSAGMTADEIVAEYPPLTLADVAACLERAAEAERARHEGGAA